MVLPTKFYVYNGQMEKVLEKRFVELVTRIKQMTANFYGSFNEKKDIFN